MNFSGCGLSLRNLRLHLSTPNLQLRNSRLCCAFLKSVCAIWVALSQLKNLIAQFAVVLFNFKFLVAKFVVVLFHFKKLSAKFALRLVN